MYSFPHLELVCCSMWNLDKHLFMVIKLCEPQVACKSEKWWPYLEQEYDILLKGDFVIYMHDRESKSQRQFVNYS